MVMKNFMCHENLAINLNDRINMLIGNNGSGKSAILTALVIGLGNKATATSRSTNLTREYDKYDKFCIFQILIIYHILQ